MSLHLGLSDISSHSEFLQRKGISSLIGFQLCKGCSLHAEKVRTPHQAPRWGRCPLPTAVPSLQHSGLTSDISPIPAASPHPTTLLSASYPALLFCMEPCAAGLLPLGYSPQQDGVGSLAFLPLYTQQCSGTMAQHATPRAKGWPGAPGLLASC